MRCIPRHHCFCICMHVDHVVGGVGSGLNCMCHSSLLERMTSPTQLNLLAWCTQRGSACSRLGCQTMPATGTYRSDVDDDVGHGAAGASSASPITSGTAAPAATQHPPTAAAPDPDLVQRLEQLLQRVQGVRTRGCWGADGSPDSPTTLAHEVSRCRRSPPLRLRCAPAAGSYCVACLLAFGSNLALPVH